MKTTHPATPAFNAFGIIGLGLIGGSLAKALRAFVPGCRITVADLRPEPVHAALAEGVADEAADHHAPHFEAAFDGCDALFIWQVALLIEGRFFRYLSIHNLTPRWLNRTPVAPREKTNKNACISLPNGNQTSSSSSVSRCNASGPR